MSLFDDAKNVKYIIAPNYLIEHAEYEILIILTDISFWNEHHDKLDIWCQTHASVRQGMTVSLPDQKTLTLFCLQWQ